MTKLSPGGLALAYSTYLGGGAAEGDFTERVGIAVDGNGSAYVTGATQSPDFPVANAFQPTLQGPWDAFVTKLSPGGSALVYSTYLGGSDNDFGSGIAVDASGSAYVTGETGSTDFPVANAFQPRTMGTGTRL